MSKKIIKRTKLNNKDRKKCYICDKYDYITELHHLITICSINKILIEIKDNKEINFEDYFNKLNKVVEGIFLCPNHHTLYYKLLSEDYIEIVLMLSNDEKKRYAELFEYAKKLYEIIIGDLRKINMKEKIIREITKEKIKIEILLGIL